MQAPPNLSQMTREELEAFARRAVLRNEDLERRLSEAEGRAVEAERRVADLERRVAELEALLREPPKTSGNSSLPPSKDFKPNKKTPERSGPRKGSLGREGSWRRLSENPDEIVRVMAKRCRHCQAELGEVDQKLKCAWDKVDIPPVKPEVTRVEIYEGRCPCCGQATKPTCVPEGCEPGSPFGLNIMALALYLRVIQNISYQRLVRLFRDLFGLSISEGALDALFKRAKPRFDAEVAAILSRLRKSRVVYSDETGVRVAGKGWWNWVFGNDEIVLHVIRPSRGRAVVEEVLDGHRPAIWVSDLLGSQQGHAEAWQICLAHQLRDCQYAVEAGDNVFAPRMKRLFLRAFAIARRRQNLADATLRAYKGRLERDLDAIMALPIEHQDGRRLRKRYAKYRGSLFTFLDHRDVAPDNNVSERRLRPTATYRKVTGGFRSLWAPDLYAGVRSAIATAARKGLDAFTAIKNILAASPALAGG
jgi:transposase